jgi:hypothetical protein
MNHYEQVQFHVQGKFILREQLYSLVACEQSPGPLPPELAVFQTPHGPSSLPAAWQPGHQSAPWITKHGVTLP